jgi:DNA polymerase-3 subunit delta
MFYVFHGDDTFAQKETLADLLSKMGDPAMLELNTTRFEGIMAFSALRQACDVVPFLAKRRVVIVEGLLAAKPDETFLGKLLTYLPDMPDSARLFFMESRALPANHRLIKLAEKAANGFVRLFERPEGAALNRWIQQRVQAQGGQISPRATHMLATNIGNDLAIQENEITKLVLFAGEGRTIGAEDVTLLSPYVAEASIFDLVDALGGRDVRRTAQLLHQKLNDGTDPFYLFAMLIRQFRLLIQVKDLALKGARPHEIAGSLKLHSMVASKLHQQSHGFSLEQLERIYRHLLDVDVDVKTGKADMTTSLHLFMAALVE